MPTEFWPNAILSLVPTVAIGLLFWFVIRSIVRMDRREREVSAKIEAEERLRAVQAPSSTATRSAARSQAASNKRS